MDIPVGLSTAIKAGAWAAFGVCIAQRIYKVYQTLRPSPKGHKETSKFSSGRIHKSKNFVGKTWRCSNVQIQAFAVQKEIRRQTTLTVANDHVDINDHVLDKKDNCTEVEELDDMNSFEVGIMETSDNGNIDDYDEFQVEKSGDCDEIEIADEKDEDLSLANLDDMAFLNEIPSDSEYTHTHSYQNNLEDENGFGEADMESLNADVKDQGISTDEMVDEDGNAKILNVESTTVIENGDCVDGTQAIEHEMENHDNMEDQDLQNSFDIGMKETLRNNYGEIENEEENAKLLEVDSIAVSVMQEIVHNVVHIFEKDNKADDKMKTQEHFNDYEVGIKEKLENNKCDDERDNHENIDIVLLKENNKFAEVKINVIECSTIEEKSSDVKAINQKVPEVEVNCEDGVRNFEAMVDQEVIDVKENEVQTHDREVNHEIVVKVKGIRSYTGMQESDNINECGLERILEDKYIDDLKNKRAFVRLERFPTHEISKTAGDIAVEEQSKLQPSSRNLNKTSLEEILIDRHLGEQHKKSKISLNPLVIPGVPKITGKEHVRLNKGTGKTTLELVSLTSLIDIQSKKMKKLDPQPSFIVKDVKDNGNSERRGVKDNRIAFENRRSSKRLLGVQKDSRVKKLPIANTESKVVKSSKLPVCIGNQNLVKDKKIVDNEIIISIEKFTTEIVVTQINSSTYAKKKTDALEREVKHETIDTLKEYKKAAKISKEQIKDKVNAQKKDSNKETKDTKMGVKVKRHLRGRVVEMKI